MKPVFVLVCSAAALFAQAAAQANATYRTPEGRAGVAKSLDDPHRAERQNPEALVKLLGIRPGMTVADLGTGTGLMLPAFSAAVGPQGKVIAEDIFADFLERAKKRGAPNVTFVLGTDRDPNLPAGAVDLAFVMDAYHHFDYPADMLANIAKGLKPGGRLAIVDFYRRKGAMGPDREDFPLEHIRIDLDGVVQEVKAAGFELLSAGDYVPGSQFLAIFRKP
jgi:ubiquinone/menaquinone biosynthesis C-methylase UbiE